MSMKKIVSLFLCVAMIFAASALAESAITPGTYEGAGEGFDAAGIKVNVTLNEEGIEAIEVLENNETPSVGGAAMETLIPQIIEGQTLAVDAGCRCYPLQQRPKGCRGGCVDRCRPGPHHLRL